MNPIKYPFTLDVKRHGVQGTLSGMRGGETGIRELAITLASGRESIEFTGEEVAYMFVTRPSDTEPSIEGCQIIGNTIHYEISQSDVAEEGLVNCQLKITGSRTEVVDDEEVSRQVILYAPTFEMEVMSADVDESTLPDLPTFTALEELLQEFTSRTYDAEAYAKGTRNGVPVSSTDVAYHNNAKYYKDEIVEQAGEVAKEWMEQSEAWAVGTKSGVAVASSDETYQNNSKYYAEQAKTSETNAKTSETNASTSATYANSRVSEIEGIKTATEAIKDATEVIRQTTEGYKNSASASATSAETSATNASASATTAQTYATEATQTITTIRGYADSASASATSASNSATTATTEAGKAKDEADRAKSEADRAETIAGGKFVPLTRTVNNKALSSDITLTASDVGARPSDWTPSASDVGAVPTTRTVNGKALSADITLSASDVGAKSSDWTPATATTETLGMVKPDGSTIKITDGTISAEVITYGEDALTDDVSELTSNTMYCQVTDGNIVKSWIGVDGVAKPLSVGSPSETYSISAWCDTVGLEYDTLDDISEADMSYLMNKHASADYFVEWYEHDNSMLTDFLANDYAMKGIGKWDYICDKLFAIDSAKSALLGSAKWEYILKDKVPTMTSDTNPSGEVIYSSQLSDNGEYAYKAFDGVTSGAYNDSWFGNGATNQWVGYKFEKPINVCRFILDGGHDGIRNCLKNFKIQASNDKSIWVDLCSGLIPETFTTEARHIDAKIDNSNYYLYYRLLGIDAYGSGWISVQALQFYGRALTVSVPTMTSNTTPKGVVSSSVATSGQSSSGAVTEPYYLFTQSNTKYLDFAWGGDGTQDQYVQYEFEKPTVLESVLFKEYIRSGYKINKFEMLYLDGSSWKSCGVIDASSHTMGNEIAYNITSNVSAKTWRFHITETENGYKPHLLKLQFYGVDYSELQGVSLALTVEGAKGDNITVTDESGEIVSNVIFDSDATSKEVTIDVVSGANYTFTSSIAKATDGSGSDYSKTVALSSSGITKRLPSGYAELEYIESSGTQYIDTGVKPKSTTKIDTEYSHLNTNGCVVIGSMSSDSDYVAIGTYSNSNFGYAFGFSTKSGKAIDTLNHKFTLENGKYSIDGTESTFSSSFSSSNYSMYAFARNSSGSAGAYASARMKYLKIYEGATLVRNFIPCRRESDNAIGMYDLVTSTFYGNSGTGAFIGGKRVDVPNVSVMPSGALYWFGNECEDATGGFDTNGKYTNSSDYSFNSLYTRNTNSISSALPTYPKVNSLAFNNLIGGVNGKKLCMLRKCGDVSSIEKAERTMENDSVYIVCNYINNNISYGAFNITVASNKTYFGNNWLYGGLGVNNQTNTNYIYALWLE